MSSEPQPPQHRPPGAPILSGGAIEREEARRLLVENDRLQAALAASVPLADTRPGNGRRVIAEWMTVDAGTGHETEQWVPWPFVPAVPLAEHEARMTEMTIWLAEARQSLKIERMVGAVLMREARDEWLADVLAAIDAVRERHSMVAALDAARDAIKALAEETTDE